MNKVCTLIISINKETRVPDGKSLTDLLGHILDEFYYKVVECCETGKKWFYFDNINLKLAEIISNQVSRYDFLEAQIDNIKNE